MSGYCDLLYKYYNYMKVNCVKICGSCGVSGGGICSGSYRKYFFFFSNKDVIV